MSMDRSKSMMTLAAMALVAGSVGSSDHYSIDVGTGRMRTPSFVFVPRRNRTGGGQAFGLKKYYTRRSGRKSSRARAMGLL